MREEIYDVMPGGGPAWETNMVAPTGRLNRLHKGAKAPPQPPPPPAVPEVDEAGAVEMERRNQKRKTGLARSNAGTLLKPRTGGGVPGASSFQIGQTTAPKSTTPTYFNRGH